VRVGLPEQLIREVHERGRTLKTNRERRREREITRRGADGELELSCRNVPGLLLDGPDGHVLGSKGECEHLRLAGGVLLLAEAAEEARRLVGF
jgi:hypothetical protein